MPIESGYSGGMRNARKLSSKSPSKTVNRVAPKTGRVGSSIGKAASRAVAKRPAIKAGTTIGRSAASGARKVTARKAGTSTGAAAKRGYSSVSRRSAPAPRQSYSRQASYSPAPSYGGGGGGAGFASSSVGSTGVGTFGALAAPPEPPQPKTWEELSGGEQEDYLGGDSAYVAQRAALLQALADEEASADRESNDFGQDIAKTLRNLGWGGAKFEADDAKDQYKFSGGAWNPQDRLGAFGQAFGNQENDFASRGMLDSSAYDTAHTDLRNSFDQQRGDVMDSFTTFLNNAMGRRTSARNTMKSDDQRARADAIARRAASLGLV